MSHHIVNKISEDEIRETFYNIMLDRVLEYKNVDEIKDNLKNNEKRMQVLKPLITHTISTMCHRKEGDKGFPTIRNNWITEKSVPDQFFQLFASLNLLTKMDNKQDYELTLQKIINQIIQLGTFKQIIDKFTSFYIDAQTEIKKEIINEDTIRLTFYNMMIDQLFNEKIINIDDLKDRDPYIYIGMSSVVILSSVKYSKNSNGILLHNGSIVTLDKCPESYKSMFQQLILIKKMFADLKLTDDQIKLITLYSLTDPNVVIPENLEELKTPALMKIVSTVTSISNQISQVAYFKQIIEDVIKFYLELNI
jgi:hypothetical protein